MSFELQEAKDPRYLAIQNTIDAVALKVKGLSNVEIASRLGVTPSTVGNYLRTALKRVAAEDVETLRGLEAQRLDELWATAWDKAQDGDLRAMDRLLAISKRRSELLGLDKKFDKDIDEDSGPKAIVIEAYARPTEDGVVSPSGEGVAVEEESGGPGGGDG